ncbi:MAG TPA: SIMPL domain-containing protein [Prosthecobacter sp.]
MKTRFMLSWSLVLILSSAAVSSYGQSVDTRRHVEVSATAKIVAEADIASWQLRIRGEAPALAKASASLDESAQALVQRLKEAGVPADALRLSGIASGRHFEENGRERVFKGYFAERSAAVELKDLGKRQVLETALLADDRVEIVQVTLRSTRHEELRRESLFAAVAAAKEKAAALAREAGAEISTVLEIRETVTNPVWNSSLSNRIAVQDGEGGSVEFERIEYPAAVTLKFALK